MKSHAAYEKGVRDPARLAGSNEATSGEGRQRQDVAAAALAGALDLIAAPQRRDA